MINQIFLIFSAIIIYEFINYLNIKTTIKNNIELYIKIFQLFKLKNTSDFRKEKLIFRYSKILFINSLKILIILLIILIFLALLNLLSNSFFPLIFSIQGFIELFVFFIIYNKFRYR